MRWNDWIRGIACLAVCIVAAVPMSVLADVDGGCTMTPVAVARGETLTLDIWLENTSSSDLTGTTLFVPLPLGADQCSAEVSTDGVAWQTYPPNGLIALGLLPALGRLDVGIRFRVEVGAPARLNLIAQLLHASGVLWELSGTANVLPSVDAGPDLIVELGATCLLIDASVSDGGGEISVVEWTDGGAGGSFDDPHTLHATYHPPAASGVFELTLTGVDADDGASSDALRVRVNAPPWIHTGPGVTANEGETVTLSQIEFGDPDGWIGEIQWDDGGAGGTFLVSGSAPPVYMAPTLEGCGDRTITLTLTVVDEWGATSSDAVAITVLNVNAPPRVHMPDHVTATSGETVTLTGLATDDDGFIATQFWTQISGPTVDADADHEGQTLTFVAPEVAAADALRFRFIAVDDCGDRGEGEIDVLVSPRIVEDEDDDTDDQDDDTDDQDGDTDDQDDDTFGALTVRIEILDRHGVAISALHPPACGDTVIVRVHVLNTGTSTVSGLAGSLDSGQPVALMTQTLPPWSSTVGECEWVVPTWTRDDAPSLQATVVGTDQAGRDVVGSCTYAFVEGGDDASGLTLTVVASTISAAVGDELMWVYTVSNPGDVPLTSVTVDDDGFGRLDLPGTDLAPGETMTACRSTSVSASDLPGPLTHWAIARAFTAHGDCVEAEAGATVELAPAVAGAGGTTAGAAHIVISEIAWAGSASDPTAEWIELANLDPDPVSLEGWTIAWYEKRGEIPPRETWTTVELSGVIGPRTTSDEAPLTFVPVGDDLWAVSDARWSSERAEGYYLLERGSDDVVADVRADLVYGSPANMSYDLPNAGGAVFLLDPDGRVVDSANAQYEGEPGWIAGCEATGATMERIDLSRGDYAANWQTSLGILAYGLGRTGESFGGSAGQPNARPLEELLEQLGEAVSPTVCAAAYTVTIPDVSGTYRPTIQVTASDLVSPAGGGGAIAVPSIATDRTGTTLQLTVDLTAATVGDYCIWIGLENGCGLVLPLRKPSEE